jgi:hypothetical protein
MGGGGGAGKDPQARALRGSAASSSHVGYGATDGETAVRELTLECEPLLLDDAAELGL